jgi:hypothetical protein
VSLKRLVSALLVVVVALIVIVYVLSHTLQPR